MSHEATNWAIRQRGLRPAAKLVLWHLADRHTPDHGCFPNQLRLAADCEMSRSALNSNLDELERRGLIRRIRRLHPQTKRQMSTRYILGFERDFGLEPCPETGHGIQAEPCPDSAQSRVRNPDTNSVKETTTTTPPAAVSDSGFVDSGEEDDPPFHDPAGTCLEACGTGLSDESRRVIMASSDVVLGWLDAGFDMDLDVLPVLRGKTRDPVDRVIRTWDYFTQAIREAHRRRTRVRPPPPARKARSRPAAASDGGPADGAGAPYVDRAGFLAWLAGQINGSGHVPPSMVSNTTRDELLARGLVTADRLRARQIY